MRIARAVGALTAASVTLAAFAVATAAFAQPPRDSLLVVVHRAPGTVGIFKVVDKDITLLKTLPVGKTPREVALSPDGRRAYVSNQEGLSVTVIDLEKMAVAGTISDPNLKGPDGGLVSRDGKKFYVVAMERDSLFVVATDTLKVTTEIPLKLSVPRRVTYSPDGRKIYVTANKTDEIVVMDAATEKITNRIPVGGEPRGGLAFTPDGKRFVAGAVEDDTLYYVDAATEKVTRILGTPVSPQRVVFNPAGTAFVLCRSGSVFAIQNLDKHDKNVVIPIGLAPWGLDISGDGKYVFASNNVDDTISIIDSTTLKVVNTVRVDHDPNGIAFRK
jgi:YVTN family beta-propeller protein